MDGKPRSEVANFVLQDANRVLWQTSVDPYGNLIQTQVARGPVSVIVLEALDRSLWRLVVSTAGVLSPVPYTVLGARGASWVLLTTGDQVFQYRLSVLIPPNSVPRLVTQLDPSWPAGTPRGELLQPNDAYPPFLQPGGPGTATFPQQPIGEKLGMWTASCGHFFNHWMVLNRAYLGVFSAYICCPICNFVQRTVTPQELIYTDAFFIIIG